MESGIPGSVIGIKSKFFFLNLNLSPSASKRQSNNLDNCGTPAQIDYSTIDEFVKSQFSCIVTSQVSI